MLAFASLFIILHKCKCCCFCDSKTRIISCQKVMPVCSCLSFGYGVVGTAVSHTLHSFVYVCLCVKHMCVNSVDRCNVCVDNHPEGSVKFSSVLKSNTAIFRHTDFVCASVLVCKYLSEYE